MDENSNRKAQQPGRSQDRPHEGKVPGKDLAQESVPVTQVTQKGKKVDADPTQESDRPIEQDL